MLREIRCSECKKKGYPPVLLGVVADNTEGVLYLWCRRCKKEIRVEVKGGNITTKLD